MSNIAPSPSSSSSGEDNGSDTSNSKGTPPSPGSSSSSKSPPNSKGESSTPPSPSSSGGSRSSSPSDSQDSSSSGPPAPSGSSPPSRSSPSPSSQPSPKSPPSSSNGGNSKSSPPPSPPSDSSQNSSQNSGNSNSSPPPGSKSPTPPQLSGGSPPSPSSSRMTPPTESGDSSSSSSSSRAPPSRSSPSPPERSNNDQSNSEPSPRNPGSSPPSPPAPTNASVVFIPVPVTSNSPPGSVAIPPGSSVVTSTNLPGSTPSSQAANSGSQVPGSPGTSNNSAGSSTNSDALSQSSLSSSKVGTSHVAAAIAGATITGLMFVVVAVFLVVSRRKKKRSTDGIVYINDGSYYVHSGQLGGANQSGMLYQQPPGASTGFSYGPAPTSGMENAGGGYYQSGIMDSKSSFSYEELTSITSNFSRDNVIGEGGFGCVYKGWLGDGKCVAVKQLKAGSGQGEREFQAEVEIISRVHHRHLVSLVGYCVAAHHRMLIYEFVPNGTLEHHLHGRGVPVMDWPTRLRIAIGAAKGLAYLHEDCHPRIIHRDIKSANILLDYSFEAQVADFGLAKLSNDTNTHVSTRIMGTFGYLAPEYASSGKLTDRSDVFSFGVVLLELITGRKPVDQTRPLGEESLVEWARPVLANAVETCDLDALVDPRLDGAYNKGEMTVMVEAAAACVRHSAPKRPRMVQVMRALDDDAGGMSDLSNGVKVGQSRAYGSGSHVEAIQQLRLTAFASQEFTGEFEQSREYSETQPINKRLG